MSRVDFYILSGTGDLSQHNFVCRLTEKAYRLNHTVHIHTTNRQQAEQLNKLLWTFRDGSFVPHQLLDLTYHHTNAPVTIGFEEKAIGAQDLLINLTEDIPKMASSFHRIAELVTSDKQSLKQSRKRFLHYKKLGAKLETHNI